MTVFIAMAVSAAFTGAPVFALPAPSMRLKFGKVLLDDAGEYPSGSTRINTEMAVGHVSSDGRLSIGSQQQMVEPSSRNAHSTFTQEFKQWDQEMQRRECIGSTSTGKCHAPPLLSLHAVEDFRQQQKAGLTGKCGLRVLKQPPSTHEFVKHKLYKEPFIFHSSSDQQPLPLDDILDMVKGISGAAMLDATFGTLKNRHLVTLMHPKTDNSPQLQKTNNCKVRYEDALSYIFQDGAQEDVLRACPEYLVDLPDGVRRSLEVGLGGFVNESSIGKSLWRIAGKHLGGFEPWGGLENVDHDYKAQRPFFQSAGARTPLHVDRVPQILSQLNGSKYIVLASNLSPEWYYKTANHLGYLDRDLLDEGLQGGAEKLHACVLQPGQSLYLPAWWYHDVFTLQSSFALGTRFDCHKMRTDFKSPYLHCASQRGELVVPPHSDSDSPPSLQSDADLLELVANAQ